MAQHQGSSQTIAFTFHSTPNHRSNSLDPSQHTILYCHMSYISFTKYVHTDITSCKRPEITAHFMASTRIYSPNMLLQFYAPQPITTKTTTLGAFVTSKDHYLLHSIHLQHLFTKHALVVLHTSIAPCHKEDSTLGAFATSRDHCSLPLATHLFTKHALIQLTSYSSTHIHSSSTRKKTALGAFATSRDHCSLHSIHSQHLFTKCTLRVSHTSITPHHTDNSAFDAFKYALGTNHYFCMEGCCWAALHASKGSGVSPKFSSCMSKLT